MSEGSQCIPSIEKQRGWVHPQFVLLLDPVRMHQLHCPEGSPVCTYTEIFLLLGDDRVCINYHWKSITTNLDHMRHLSQSYSGLWSPSSHTANTYGRSISISGYASCLKVAGLTSSGFGLHLFFLRAAHCAFRSNLVLVFLFPLN